MNVKDTFLCSCHFDIATKEEILARQEIIDSLSEETLLLYIGISLNDTQEMYLEVNKTEDNNYELLSSLPNIRNQHIVGFIMQMKEINLDINILDIHIMHKGSKAIALDQDLNDLIEKYPDLKDHIEFSSKDNIWSEIIKMTIDYQEQLLSNAIEVQKSARIQIKELKKMLK